MPLLDKYLFRDPSSESETASEEDDPSDTEDFTKEGLNAKEVVLCISKSIVSLVSSVDGKPLFACTGTVVDHVSCATWILTSATLFRKPGTDHDAYQADEVKIEVLLHNKRTIDGHLAMCNLQYNIAIVTVESQLDLPMVALNDLPGSYSTLVRPVIAVGRDSKSQVLLVRHGDMIRERIKLDCSELLVCTCPVSKTFIGGLVMDFERRIIGITFCGKDTTPVMPIEIMARCLKHFKYFRAVKQPCLCIWGCALHSLEISNLEKICYKFPDLSSGSGIVVDKICGVLSENCEGIEADDIICSIDGVILHSVAQLTAILLDTMVGAMCSQNTVILQAYKDPEITLNLLQCWIYGKMVLLNATIPSVTDGRCRERSETLVFNS
uniref:PDZ domain-containing protein n=1 Tax=Arundo donax TaxID=35708 RepID=A0A0A9H6W0_ARUDO